MKDKKENMNIVVFGCDNTGKTRLTSVIRDEFDYAGINCGIVGSIGKAEKDVQEKYIVNNLCVKGVKIFDRFTPIEEYVCGNVLRGKSNFNLDEIKKYAGMIDVFVFCYPGLFSVLNWGEREQMDGVKENVLDLISNYNCMAVWLKENGFNVIEYNYNVKGFENKYGQHYVINEIMENGGFLK